MSPDGTNGTYYINGTNYSVPIMNLLQAVFDKVASLTSNHIYAAGTITIKPGDYPFTNNVFLCRSQTNPVDLNIIGYGARWHYVGTTNIPYNGGLLQVWGADSVNPHQADDSTETFYNFRFEGLTFISDQDWSGWTRFGTNNFEASDNRRFFAFRGTKNLEFVNCSFLSSNAFALGLTEAHNRGFNKRPSGLVWLDNFGSVNNVFSVQHCWFGGGAAAILSFSDNADIEDNLFSEVGAWDDGTNIYGGIDLPITSPYSGNTLHLSAFSGIADNGCGGMCILNKGGISDSIQTHYKITGNKFNYCAVPMVYNNFTGTTFENNVMLSPVEVLFGEYYTSFLSLQNNVWVVTPMVGFTNAASQPALGLGNGGLLTNLPSGQAYVEIGNPTCATDWFWKISQDLTNYFGLKADGTFYVRAFFALTGLPTDTTRQLGNASLTNIDALLAGRMPGSAALTNMAAGNGGNLTNVALKNLLFNPSTIVSNKVAEQVPYKTNTAGLIFYFVGTTNVP
jgi:hypothetical protein